MVDGERPARAVSRRALTINHQLSTTHRPLMKTFRPVGAVAVDKVLNGRLVILRGLLQTAPGDERDGSRSLGSAFHRQRGGAEFQTPGPLGWASPPARLPR